MALGERKTTTVTTSASNIDFNADGYAVLVDLNITSSWDGTVDFQTTIDGSNYFNVPYITLATLSASPSVSQLTSLSTARYLLLGPLTQTRISCSAGSTGTLIAVYRVVPSNSPWTSLVQGVESAGLGIQGAVASDAADSGNPVKVGAKAFTGNRPTVSNNDRVDLSADKHGHLFTVITGSANNTTPVDVSGADADAKGSSTSVLSSRSFLVGLAPVGNEWDRLRTVGDAAPGLGTLRTSPTGHNFSNITSATSTAVMAAAGVLHTITINTVSADGTITLHNDPDSADTPFGIITVVSSGFASVTLHYDIYLSAGLYIVTSSAVNITVSYAL